MEIALFWKARRSAVRILISLGAFAFLSPYLAYANPLCKGAQGFYVEDTIRHLQNDRTPGRDVKVQERVAANLQVWLNANQKIANTAGFTQRIFVCLLPGLNAFVTTKDEPIRVHLETVDILGADEAAIAALLGHEYSHLSLKHRAKKIVAAETLRTWTRNVFANAMRRTWNVQEASKQANLFGEREWSAFSIQHELEADDFGIQLLSKSGYKPSAFLKLASIGIALYGTGTGNANSFPSHPGFLDRMTKADERVTDETFDQTAAELEINNDFAAISNLIKDWMSRLPDSGNARYYKAVLLRQSKNAKATEMMEDAFLSARPTISKRRVELDSAWLWLCTQLYREGYVVESAWCGETQLKQNDLLWTKFQSRTFQDRVWVGFRNDGNSGDGNIYIAFIKKPDGAKLITNVVDTAVAYGAGAEEFTPIWRPIRFKTCGSKKALRCVSEVVEQSMAIATSEADPFREVRSSCRPPNCRTDN